VSRVIHSHLLCLNSAGRLGCKRPPHSPTVSILSPVSMV
jgi:hypothetical protein